MKPLAILVCVAWLFGATAARAEAVDAQAACGVAWARLPPGYKLDTPCNGHSGVKDDPSPITLDQLALLAVDSRGGLYWDGKEIVTTLALPWIVNIAAVVTAVATAIMAALSVWRFIDRWRNRSAPDE